MNDKPVIGTSSQPVAFNKSASSSVTHRPVTSRDKSAHKVIVSLKKVNKFYGTKHVLKDVSLDIYEGDRVAFLGGNGSGKSTTVEIIAKVKEATNGKIVYDPNIVVGIQFQESNYPFGVTTKALMDFYTTRYRTELSSEKIKELLKIFRLEKLYKKQISNMSGGQKQRLNILLALIHKPNFLILDELSTGLDIKVRRELRTFITGYLNENPKTSMVLITHSMGEAQEMCNRVVILDWGVIKYDLPMTEVLAKYQTLENFANIIFEKMYASLTTEERKRNDDEGS